MRTITKWQVLAVTATTQAKPWLLNNRFGLPYTQDILAVCFNPDRSIFAHDNFHPLEPNTNPVIEAFFVNIGQISLRALLKNPDSRYTGLAAQQKTA